MMIPLERPKARDLLVTADHSKRGKRFVTILDPEVNRVTILEPWEHAILMLCDGARTAPEIAEMMAYARDDERVDAAHVYRCLTFLQQRGLLEAVDAESPDARPIGPRTFVGLQHAFQEWHKDPIRSESVAGRSTLPPPFIDPAVKVRVGLGPTVVLQERDRVVVGSSLVLDSNETADPNEVVAPNEAVDPNEAVAPNEAVDPNEAVAPNEVVDPNEAVAPNEVGDPNEAMAPSVEQESVSTAERVTLEVQPKDPMSEHQTLLGDLGEGRRGGVAEVQYGEFEDPPPAAMGNVVDWLRAIDDDLLKLELSEKERIEVSGPTSGTPLEADVSAGQSRATERSAPARALSRSATVLDPGSAFDTVEDLEAAHALAPPERSASDRHMADLPLVPLSPLGGGLDSPPPVSGPIDDETNADVAQKAKFRARTVRPSISITERGLVPTLVGAVVDGQIEPVVLAPPCLEEEEVTAAAIPVDPLRVDATVRIHPAAADTAPTKLIEEKAVERTPTMRGTERPAQPLRTVLRPGKNRLEVGAPPRGVGRARAVFEILAKAGLRARRTEWEGNSEPEEAEDVKAPGLAPSPSGHKKQDGEGRRKNRAGAEHFNKAFDSLSSGDLEAALDHFECLQKIVPGSNRLTAFVDAIQAVMTPPGSPSSKTRGALPEPPERMLESFEHAIDDALAYGRCPRCFSMISPDSAACFACGLETSVFKPTAR